jgi:LPS-assembly lipoprotein
MSWFDACRPGVRRWWLTCILLLASCGFQLRGEVVIPFRDIFITAPPGSHISADLNRTLIASKTKLAPSAAKAEAQLSIVDESRDKIILSLSGAGRVREFQLKLRVGYQLTDDKGAVLIPRTEVNLTRIMSYDDQFVLAKQKEEELLFNDMENDVVLQIMRRLSQAKRTG